MTRTTRSMPRLTVLLLAALAIAVVAQPAHAQQKLSRGHAALPTVSVRLFASVGAVQVVGWDRDSVHLSGMIAKGSRAELGAPRAGRVEGLKLFVETLSGEADREGRLTLHVPRGARVWVKTGSADVEVSGVSGGIDVNVVGGSIAVHGDPRELRAESMDGSVTVNGSPEWVRVKTATGDIALVGGQNVGASSISGAITVKAGDIERMKLETTTGAIRFALGKSRGAVVELETHSGPIDVLLPRRADVELDAATVTGTIETSWLKARPVMGREGRGMTLTTFSGMAGARVVVRTFKGRIALQGS